ncbi:MAG: ribonuclease H family protein, partial [Pseudanabaena sp.]
PLFDLLSVDPKTYNIGEKGSAANIAFEELKKRLTSYPIMRLPDFNKPFVVIPDASAVGTGAVLAQEHEGFEHPVHYISKSLAKTQRHRHVCLRFLPTGHRALISLTLIPG